MSKLTIAVTCLILLVLVCAGAILNARIGQHRNPQADTIRAQSVNTGEPGAKSFSPREYIRIIRQWDE